MKLFRSQTPFPATRWTLILTIRENRGGAEAKDALSSLCNNYWAPLYCFARRKGLGLHDAKDVTQGFFAYAIERELFAAANPELGRLRTFLITAFSRYMRDVRDCDQAEKRGGGTEIFSFDAKAAEDRLLQEPATTASPDKCFDRTWAHAILEVALARLGEEEINKRREPVFRELRPLLLMENFPEERYAEIASRLAMSEVSIRQAVKQLRTRYYGKIRRQVAETLRNPSKEKIDEEILSLKAALRL